MSSYPIFMRTMLVVVPTCSVVPVAGLLIGILVAALLTMAVIP